MSTIFVTTDGVIMEEGRVLLMKRGIEPFKGCWILPGGHIEYGEKVEEALKREVKEEINVLVKPKKIIGVYSDPQRDPRGHVISIAFLCERKEGEFSLGEEGTELKFFPWDRLPEKMGFDHRKIIRDAKKVVNQ